MITMKEIAREAGVSQPAVSLVLNGRGQSSRISESTRERVLAAAGRLGYHRNELARAMKTGKTSIIGIVGALGSGYSLEIVKGVSEAAAAAGYTIKLLPAHDAATMTAVCRQCLEQRLAGIIVRSVTEEEMGVLLRELSPYSMPMAFVGNIATPDEHPHVSTDDRHGMTAAVRHLVELGHRRIAFLDSGSSLITIRSRRDGFFAAMREHVADESPLYKEIIRDDAELQRQEIAGFLKETGATAVIGVSDFMAMRVLQAASTIGLRVPEDLAVVGFGDLDFSGYANPPLTTIRQPFAAMGRIAAEQLIARISGRNIERKTVLPVELIVRRSTAAPTPH